MLEWSIDSPVWSQTLFCIPTTCQAFIPLCNQSTVPCFASGRCLKVLSLYASSAWRAMGSMIGQLAQVWERVREISLVGICDVEHEQCGNMEVEQGEHGSRPQREAPKAGVREVRRPLCHSDSKQYLKLSCMMYPRLWSSCCDTVHPGCSVPLRTNLPIKFMVSADLPVCSHLAGENRRAAFTCRRQCAEGYQSRRQERLQKKHWKEQVTVSDCNYCQSQKDNGKRSLKQECWGCNSVRKFSIFNAEDSTT